MYIIDSGAKALPNKTIYIKDSDLSLWDRAQQELGESVSSTLVDYLRERLETEALRKKAKKAGRMDEIQAMKTLLAEINSDLNLDIELHPSWSYPILDPKTANLGYKLHQKRANPDRIMSLVVWPLDFELSGRINPATKERIKAAIQRFWDGKTTEPHRFVDATK
ncbi:MAG: hypothetical protein WAM39_07130 [Bryobacteraceae bacterium]